MASNCCWSQAQGFPCGPQLGLGVHPSEFGNDFPLIGKFSVFSEQLFGPPLEVSLVLLGLLLDGGSILGGRGGGRRPLDPEMAAQGRQLGLDTV